ncbi:MAG: hypothetical protein AB7F91_00750 [Parvularculaceae bacterium]
MPPLLALADEAAYRAHFIQSLCRAVITTHDGIRVFFKPDTFDHAFFESSDRRGADDVFSLARAERMDWIATALADPNALCVQGWDKRLQCYTPRRRVTVIVQDFVIVLALSANRNGTLKANFVTCFKAENSAVKIRQAPRWTMQDYDNAT